MDESIWQFVRRLTQNERILILTLITLSDERGVIIESMRSLSEIVGLSRRKLSYGIKRFQELGILERENVSEPQVNHLTFTTSARYKIFEPLLNHKEQEREQEKKERETKEQEIFPLITPIIEQENKEKEIKEKDKEKEKDAPFKMSPEPTKKPKKKKPIKVFVKPTVEEIANYAKENNLYIDAHHFFDYYESIGWLVGKARTPMKDWKASIRTWIRNQNKYGYGTTNAVDSKTQREQEYLRRSAEFLANFKAQGDESPF